MKKYLLIILSFLLYDASLFSQGFAGINTGNYAGVTGVMLQPASIVDSRHKFDINIFSTNARYSNNYFLLDRNVLLKFNKNNFEEYQTFKSKYLSEANLAPNEKVFFNISNRTQLPLSFMVTLNDKSAFAFNLQSRTMLQGRNISQDLAKLAYNGFYHDPLNNQEIDASGINLRSLSWVEAGLTYGRVLLNSGNHFLKGAVTAKYLGGVASLNLSGNNLTVQTNNDSSFNFTADRVNYDHSENAEFNRVIDTRFRPDANAFGFDAGLVYEFRGHLNNIKYIRNDDEESHEVKRRDLNKYIFRLGVSVLDGGMFRFRGTDNINPFSANITNWNIRNANYSSISDFDTALANRVTPLGNDLQEYNVFLPGAFSVQMDVRFVKGLYLNAMAYRPLKMGNETGTRFNNYGYYTITPRYERRHFGIYIPYTFTDREEITNYRDNWLGLTLRLGPVFLGSSNLGTMAFNQKVQSADFFVGLKMGITYGKPSNISRWFEPKKDSTYDMLLLDKQNSGKYDTVTTVNQENKKEIANRDSISENQLIVDYSKGQVYNGGKPGQVVIINNYNYYGNVPPTRLDSNNISNLPFGVEQQNAIRMDSAAMINQAQKARMDSANKKFNDSLIQKRKQLDSLIDKLNNLRQRLDSTKMNSTNAAGINYENNSSGDSILQKNNVVSLQDSIIRDTIQNQNIDSNYSQKQELLMNDSVPLINEEATKKDSSKKKLDTALKETPQLNNAVYDNSLRRDKDITTPAYNNTAATQPEQNVNADAYEAIMRQSKRLQADIERLERQMAYNRSLANTPVRQPNYNPTIHYNVIPPPNNFYPVTVPVSTQNVRDTIFIRDTIFVTKTDTITKEVQTEPSKVIAAVPQEKIAEEKIDYKKLPPENILFATGKSVIGQVYVQKLNYLAVILKENPELKIAITGHTDKTGSPAINELLSLKRANAVKTFFVNNGINETRMQITAVASVDPLVEGGSKNANSQNRRVEIRIL